MCHFKDADSFKVIGKCVVPHSRSQLPPYPGEALPVLGFAESVFQALAAGSGFKVSACMHAVHSECNAVMQRICPLIFLVGVVPGLLSWRQQIMFAPWC